jgi:hypothetical protein
MDWIFILAVSSATVVGFAAGAVATLWVLSDELNKSD